MNSTENVGGGIAPVLGPVQPSLLGATNRGSNSPAGGSRIGNQGAVAVNRVVNNGGNVSGVSQGGPLVAGSIVSSPSGRGLVSTSSLGFRGELNPALVGMGDDGGYGGAWVPLAALKKVLRQTLRYLGVLWLFAQFPSILKDVLGRILRENEGALLNHDPEQPALRFFIGYHNMPLIIFLSPEILSINH
jgi:mediator of RNA polymerase II transcription subunit 14